MKGQKIILSAEPRGVFMEGTITDASYPGMCMEIVPSTTFVGGRPSFRARSAAAGAKGPIFVLLPDTQGGQLATTVYTANTHGFLYAPAMGEELNMLVGDVAGTGDTIAQGDLFGVNNDGKLKANSSYTSAPFQAMEAITSALTADKLVWMIYHGNNA